MKGVLFQLRLLRRVLLRKARTALQGAPTHPEFVRAAHYFSDGWALNVWQILAPSRVLSELRTIREDGFNTIILVVPWRGFQVDQLHPVYDDFYERQIRRVLAAAEKIGLSVIVRVGYTHQVFVDSHVSGVIQAQRLLVDEETREAWLDYLHRLYLICHGYRSFRQGFLSWEEFWHAFHFWQLGKEQFRQERAEKSGFLAYLAMEGVEGVDAIPEPGGASQADYHAFTNARIRQMYEYAAQAFPGLGMEVRVDKDRLQEGDSVRWANNDHYTDIDSLRYTYWAPFMGASNEGEKLDAEQAAGLFEHMLNEISKDGGHPNHVVDQFNFVDETPEFKNTHAEIAEEEVAGFLQRAVPLLRGRSRGYGVWAYRDYRQNILYNARFVMGLRGWQAPRGGARRRRRGGIRLAAGAVLRQHIPPPLSGLQRRVVIDTLHLAVARRRPSTRAGLQVRINTGPWQAVSFDDAALESLLEIAVHFGSIMADGLILEIINTGDTLELESLALFHWVFRGGIRLEDGTPSRHHQAVVAFNRALATDQTG